MSIISIFGLGYVGTVTAACLAREGQTVIGVDVNPVKLDLIRRGRSPIVEEGLEGLIAEATASGQLTVSDDAQQAVLDSDLSLICVGTPSAEDGTLDLSQVRRVAADIGAALREKDDYHVVVFRSTMLPGSVERDLMPILEAQSGKQAGTNFGICMNPEFLREGSSIADFYDPPKTVIGELDWRSGDTVERLYSFLSAPVFRVPIRVAEMVKYVDNAFHALKVGFANEIGRICKQGGVDSHQVMDIFRADTKLNISAAYLQPGFAFGGSCLPKDLRALLAYVHGRDGRVPILEAILPSNEQQIQAALDMICATGHRRVGVLGLSFKEGTDDLRESPVVRLVKMLIDEGHDVCVHDRFVSLGYLTGTNKAYIEREMPYIANLMCSSPDKVVARSKVIVVTVNSSSVTQALKEVKPDQVVIDLVRVLVRPEATRGRYMGIAW